MYFFQCSKNGRRDATTHRKKKRIWAKPNNSTMNRICRAFDDIGNINMNWAGVELFNWKMLLSEECVYINLDMVTEFCELDSIKVSIAIANIEESPAERDVIDNTTIIDEHIVNCLTKRFGSLEACYPSITAFLFNEENVSKAAHKQVYWRIFGDIAIRNLRRNLEHCYICRDCNAKVPVWDTSHLCPKGNPGYYKCIECGKLCQRTNSRQTRCPDCQEHHRVDMRKLNKIRKKERQEQFSTFLQYRFKKT